MKQKRVISGLSFRQAVFFLLISVPLLLSAQENKDSLNHTTDPLSAKPENILKFPQPDLFPEIRKVTPPSYPSGQSDYLPGLSVKRETFLPYHTNPSLNFRGDYFTEGVWKQFAHGALFGSGRQTSMPGIGRINEASFGYRHVFNPKLSFQLSANAMKINMAHLAGQAFSTSGMLLYRPSERIALKLFGSYDIGNSYGMSTPRYGATLSFDMSERFGMEMGVQRYYDSVRGRWETVPVMIPYYHFDKFTLGFDVGGLLYEILREFVFDKQGGGSPTIRTPRFQMPIK